MVDSQLELLILLTMLNEVDVFSQFSQVTDDEFTAKTQTTQALTHKKLTLPLS